MSRRAAATTIALAGVIAAGCASSRAGRGDGVLVRPVLGAAPTWTAPPPTETVLPSGLRVVLLRQAGVPLVHLTVVVKAGGALDGEGREGLGAAVAAMLVEGGAGVRTGDELAEAFAALGDELRIHFTHDAAVLELTTRSSNLERALALLSDVLMRPRFDDDEWQRVRARRIAELLKERDEPRKVADRVFERVVYGESHPYGRPWLGTPRSIEKLTARDLRDFYAAHYGPRTTSLLLVGDIGSDPDRLVGSALSGWASPAAPVGVKPAAASRSARFVLVDRPGAPQSEVRVGGPGIERASADYPPALLVGVLLGGSFTSRLNQNLREKHGYTYGAHAQFELHDTPGHFVVASAIRTDVTAPALGEILSELKAIRAPLDPAEIAKGRALIAGEIVEHFGDGGGASKLLSELLAHGAALDGWSRLPAELAKLEPAPLAATTARLIDPDRAIVVIVGDRKAIEAPLRALLPPGVTLELRDADGAPLPAPKTP